MQLTVNNYKKEGALNIQIGEPFIITDLNADLTINSHGLQEITLNMSKLFFSGSSSFTQRVDEIYTEYKLSINTYKFKESAYKQCKLDYDCNSLIADEAHVMNKLYSAI